jgi:hypothetical protein
VVEKTFPRRKINYKVQDDNTNNSGRAREEKMKCVRREETKDNVKQVVSPRNVPDGSDDGK